MFLVVGKVCAYNARAIHNRRDAVMKGYEKDSTDSSPTPRFLLQKRFVLSAPYVRGKNFHLSFTSCCA